MASGVNPVAEGNDDVEQIQENAVPNAGQNNE